jgi:hypothetical protein
MQLADLLREQLDIENQALDGNTPAEEVQNQTLPSLDSI